MKRIFHHFRVYVLRGLLALIPIVISVLVIHFLYVIIDQRVMGFVNRSLGFRVPGLGILLLILILYSAGLIASNVLGKQLFHLIDRISNRIPLVKTTYQVGKKLVQAFSGTDKQVFKRSVLVQLKPNIWTLAFVAGEMIDKKHHDEVILKLFVPMPPNPASGTVLFVKASEVRDPGWTLEETIGIIISDGIISPPEIH